MLVKKLAVAAASAALMLGAMAPAAFAWDSNGVHVDNNNAEVSVDSTTTANSGVNGVVTGDGANVEDVNVTSGAAVASSVNGTQVNTNTITVPSCGCEDQGGVRVDNNGADVSVSSDTTANSGVNGVVAWGEDTSVEDVTVGAGAATAASNNQTVVNTNSVTVTAGEGN